jgi:hypothetical protein
MKIKLCRCEVKKSCIRIYCIWPTQAYQVSTWVIPLIPDFAELVLMDIFFYVNVLKTKDIFCVFMN